MKLGCIADDFTGATDLAGLLRRSGASVKLHFGLPTRRGVARVRARLDHGWIQAC